MVKKNTQSTVTQLKTPVLIIEDSKSTCLLLKEYLKGMGYSDISIAETGRDGLDVFKNLHEKGVKPIILLDYFLPDMDARSIMTQLLELEPTVRVILETATEKSDSGVTELIRRGIYQYLEKPIRLEKLKEVFDTLEEEQKFFEKESAQTQAFKKAEERFYDQVDFLLKSHKQISMAMIQQYVESSSDELTSHIEDLIQDGKIVKLDKIKEICCPGCSSVKTIQTFSCPSCGENDFKLTKLIEHFKCGNFSEESTYEDNKCPKCKKEIKAVGVDYKVMQNHYVCNSCREVFQELSFRFLCLKCENKFPIKEGRWITSPFYKAIKM